MNVRVYMNIVFFVTAQKMKFSINGFFSKCDQIRTKKNSVFGHFSRSVWHIYFRQSVWTPLQIQYLISFKIYSRNLSVLHPVENLTITEELGN